MTPGGAFVVVKKKFKCFPSLLSIP